jgi:hypothetical protein
MNICDYIDEFSLECGMFQRKDVEKNKAPILYSVTPFFKIKYCMAWCGKIW